MKFLIPAGAGLISVALPPTIAFPLFGGGVASRRSKFFPFGFVAGGFLTSAADTQKKSHRKVSAKVFTVRGATNSVSFTMQQSLSHPSGIGKWIRRLRASSKYQLAR